MPLKTSYPLVCYAVWSVIPDLSKWNQRTEGVLVVIVCASYNAASQVIMLLLGERLYPRTHYRVHQTNHEISITIVSVLSAELEARLRAGIAAIPGASIQ